MMRIGIWSRVVVGAAVAFFLFSAHSAGAASMKDVVTAVGEPHSEAWRAAFASELEHLGAGSRIAGASYTTSLTVFSGQRIDGTPVDAAHLVYEVVLRVDRELRRGSVPGRVVLDARRAVARLGAGETLSGDSAQQRLRRQLSGMGMIVYGELGQRSGPQSGPGNHGGSSGADFSGGGARGKTGTSSSANGQETPGE